VHQLSGWRAGHSCQRARTAKHSGPRPEKEVVGRARTYVAQEQVAAFFSFYFLFPFPNPNVQAEFKCFEFQISNI
jgi:hypothetical protein